MSEEDEMTKLRRALSPALTAPPEGHDILAELFLRLPAQPSTLPRASLVCKNWRGLISNPCFLRRFHAQHRRNPSLLGCFIDQLRGLSFVPTMDPPNRLPRGRFSLQFDGAHYLILGCRHGLVLILGPSRFRVLVWDPVTGDQQRHLTLPPGFGFRENIVIHNGAVLRSAADVHDGCHSSPFQVVLVGDDKHQERAFACLYSSETGIWGNLVSTPLPTNHPWRSTEVLLGIPSVMVGNSLYWLLSGHSYGILEFDLDRQSLAKDTSASGNVCQRPSSFLSYASRGWWAWLPLSVSVQRPIMEEEDRF